MKKFFLIILSYLFITFNTFVFADNNNKVLKIGILAPFSEELKTLGETILFSANLALHDIGADSIKLYPVGYSNDKNEINKACEKFKEEGVKIVLGPVDSKFLKELNRCSEIVFLSLSNMDANINDNVIMMGVNLESQLLAIKKLIKKKKKKKTIILYPDNEYSKHVERNIRFINFQNSKVFKYSNDPKILTNQIEKLTNYKKRKINLNARIKKLENSEDPKDLNELNILKQRFTLGKVNFDSVVIIDFDNGLKSILTSLAYTDVSEKDVLIVAANQWFDKSILTESSIKEFYFPSVNLENLEKFKKDFFKIHNYKPNEVGILAYDCIGLIYYLWKNDTIIKSVNNFNFKKEIKGKIGKFKISDNKVIQSLEIYKLENSNFVKNKF
tara:strand:+ start:709 stop:1866 length:1158 start_codon:yes stop_codon:yes gene_type:complete